LQRDTVVEKGRSVNQFRPREPRGTSLDSPSVLWLGAQPTRFPKVVILWK
jgi:hypothetical protein